MKITQTGLREILNYDAATGVFTWLNLHGKKNSGVAGTTTSGYIRIKIGKYTYMAHRLAWMYVHGEVPEFLDHINRVRSDNRLLNLRPATKGGNRQNASMSSTNTSGRIGVSMCKRTGKWQAQIKVDKKAYHLGRYDLAEDAEAAYKAAKMKLHTFTPSLL